jgi:hypothetical protein
MTTMSWRRCDAGSTDSLRALLEKRATKMTAGIYKTDEYVSVSGRAKMSKIQRYGWMLRDRPGEFMQIDKNELQVDYEYQRDKVIQEKVREIQSNWSWAGCGCILVAMRQDGTFWVFDGQHRVLAARSRSDIANLPCLVFELDSKTHEAAGFLVANTQRKPVTAISKFKALVMTGDSAAVAVNSMFEELGLEISDNAQGARQIKCVQACLKHAASSTSVLASALRTAIDLEGDEPVHRDMLDGLVWVERKYKLLSDPKFIRRLNSISRSDIITAIGRFAAAEGCRGERVSGTAILRCVNKGLRQKFGDTEND